MRAADVERKLCGEHLLDFRSLFPIPLTLSPCLSVLCQLSSVLKSMLHLYRTSSPQMALFLEKGCGIGCLMKLYHVHSTSSTLNLVALYPPAQTCLQLLEPLVLFQFLFRLFRRESSQLPLFQWGVLVYHLCLARPSITGFVQSTDICSTSHPLGIYQLCSIPIIAGSAISVVVIGGTLRDG